MMVKVIGYRLLVIGLILLSPLTSHLSPLSAQISEMEMRYNALSERFDGRDKLLLRDLKAYREAYPYTTFADEVNFMQGVLLVEKGQYKKSLKVLEQVEAKALTRPHQMDYSFYRGYAYLMQQDYQRATIYFGHLAKTENRYTVRGAYYNAYCLYKLGKYDEALPAPHRATPTRYRRVPKPYCRRTRTIPTTASYTVSWVRYTSRKRSTRRRWSTCVSTARRRRSRKRTCCVTTCTCWVRRSIT